MKLIIVIGNIPFTCKRILLIRLLTEKSKCNFVLSITHITGKLHILFEYISFAKRVITCQMIVTVMTNVCQNTCHEI